MTIPLPRTAAIPRLAALPGTLAGWAAVPALAVDWFHPASSPHRPDTTVRIAHDGGRIGFAWTVRDAQVRAAITEVNGPTCRDSCVEAFLAPRPGGPYVALEINAAGVPFAAVIRDPVRQGAWFADGRRLDPGLIARHVRTTPSLAGPIEPERPGPCPWTLLVEVDLALFADALGAPVEAAGTWAGNLYKCADRTSTPHWGCWSPVGDELNFHQPARFGRLAFA